MRMCAASSSASSKAVTQPPGSDLLGSNSEQSAGHKPAVYKPTGSCSGRHGKGCCIQQQALGGPCVPPSCGTSARWDGHPDEPYRACMRSM